MKEETINEKRARLLDMQEHPDRYTEEAIENLLTDEDVRRFAHDMAAAKRAMRKHEREEVDVDRAWKAFAMRHRHRRRSRLKAAASTIGIILLSGVAFAAVLQWGVFRNTGLEAPTADRPAAIRKSSVMATQDSTTTPKDSVAHRPVVFDNAELATVLGQMAAHYHVDIVFRHEQSRHIKLYFKWEREKSLAQQLELLNAFDRIKLTLDDHTVTVD